MTYKLIILPRAERDVQHFFDWLSERSPNGGRRWYAAWEEAARKTLALAADELENG